MKFGKVLTYKDVAEAEKLEGKKVVASENFYLIGNEAFCREYAKQYKITLAGARKGLYPFTVSNSNKYQFIREVIDDESEDPHYEPYDLSDKKVRDSLRRRRFWDKVGNLEQMVVVFEYPKNGDEWLINGIYTASTFLRDCVWIDDGTPCGRLKNMEVR